MVTLYDSGVYLLNGKTLVPEKEAPGQVKVTREDAKKGTIAYGILQAHNHSGSMDAASAANAKRNDTEQCTLGAQLRKR